MTSPISAATPRSHADRLSRLASLRDDLHRHPLYGALRTPDDLRTFMAHHVACVWDFMTLLKSLQRDLTCVDVPWTPPSHPEAARLINAIVLDEETDVLPHRGPPGTTCHGSHFEWYLDAMDELGLDTGALRTAMGHLGSHADAEQALAVAGLPPAAQAFSRTTLGFVDAPLHVRAAVFFHGREDIIPGMFLELVRGLATQGLSCNVLVGYLDRHIEVDGDVHGPLARAMVERLCGDDPVRQTEATNAAASALSARRRLWDAVLESLPG